MSITFRLPTYLATFTGKRTSITLEDSPPTVRAALQLLWDRHPGLHDRMVDEQGEVHPQLNVFVDNNCICCARGMGASLARGAEVSILPAVGIHH